MKPITLYGITTTHKRLPYTTDCMEFEIKEDEGFVTKICPVREFTKCSEKERDFKVNRTYETQYVVFEPELEELFQMTLREKVSEAVKENSKLKEQNESLTQTNQGHREEVDRMRNLYPDLRNIVIENNTKYDKVSFLNFCLGILVGGGIIFGILTS